MPARAYRTAALNHVRGAGGVSGGRRVSFWRASSCRLASADNSRHFTRRIRNRSSSSASSSADAPPGLRFSSSRALPQAVAASVNWACASRSASSRWYAKPSCSYTPPRVTHGRWYGSRSADARSRSCTAPCPNTEPTYEERWTTSMAAPKATSSSSSTHRTPPEPGASAGTWNQCDHRPGVDQTSRSGFPVTEHVSTSASHWRTGSRYPTRSGNTSAD